MAKTGVARTAEIKKAKKLRDATPKQKVKSLKLKDIEGGTAKKLKRDGRMFAAFIEVNRGFIEQHVRKYARKGDRLYDDLVQMGRLGLWKAVKSWKPERSRLSTYAYGAVANTILTEVERDARQRRNETSLEGLTRLSETKARGIGQGYDEYNEAKFAASARMDEQRDFEGKLVERIAVEQRLKVFTDFERKVFDMRASGLTLAECAREIGMNYHTLKETYYEDVYPKMRAMAEEARA